jgi:uncharacterized membrane protein YkoI
VLLVAALLARGAMAEDACIADWSVAAPLVKKEGLVTVEELTSMARSRLEGAIVKATLCEMKGRYVFRLVVRSGNGQLKSLIVDARAPFGR